MKNVLKLFLILSIIINLVPIKIFANEGAMSEKQVKEMEEEYMKNKDPNFGKDFKVMINGGEKITNSPDVKLFFDVSERVATMKISSNTNFQGLRGEPIKPVKSWNLCSDTRYNYGPVETGCPSRMYTVYVKFYDLAGNVSPVVKASIMYRKQGTTTSSATSKSKLTTSTTSSNTKTTTPTSTKVSSTQTKAIVNPTKTVEIPEDCKFIRTLEMGHIGDQVRKLQRLLSKDPKIYPEQVVSGLYGELTRLAVGRFQTKYGIVKNSVSAGYGIFGPTTQAKLAEVMCGKNIPAVTPQKSTVPSSKSSTVPVSKTTSTTDEVKNKVDSLKKQMEDMKKQMEELLKKL